MPRPLPHLAMVMLLTATATVRAQPSLPYPCHRLAAAPVLDGRLDDEAWGTLPQADGLRTLKQAGFAVHRPTAFRLGWTSEGLYLAVHCKDPFVRLVSPLTGDGEPLWDDDSVEVFVAPPGGDTYQFIANTAGARWNGRSRAGEQPLWAWTATAHVAAEDWTVEMHLPFAVLGATPRPGDTWAFNLGRNVLNGPPAERFSCWAAVKQGFGDTANFARLSFEDAPSGEAVRRVEEALAAPFQAFIKEQAAARRNLIANASFEDGLTGWGQREPDRIAIDRNTSTLGAASVRLDGSGDPAGFVSASQPLKLKPATAYVLRCDIKRSRFASGTISVDVIERDRKDVEWTYRRCGDRPHSGDVPNTWGHYELRFETSPHLLEAMAMLYNIRSGATAWVDNLELVEDDGLETTGATRATTPVQVEVQTRAATARLLVAGEVVPLMPGQPAMVRLREGVTAFALEAEAQGPNPGIKVRIASDPVTESRWRATAPEGAAAWAANDADDRHWPLATRDADGFLWAAGDAPRAVFRQAVLWNAGHDGPDRCLNPLLKEWGISEGAMENLALMLYSPFTYALSDYEFILDVPAPFRLLDIMHETGRSQHNVRPAGLVTEAVEHDGKPYTRYRIAEAAANVAPDRITGQFLPLVLETWPAAERTTAWYYRRLAQGNLTELEQRIPVRILPPINGRLCRNIMISQYCSEPCSGYYPGARFSPEHYDQHMRQSLQAGFNTWISPAPTTAEWVRKAGGRLVIWSNYPFYGMKQATSRPGYRWLAEHPEAQARYFNDSGTWETRHQYCPSYVVGEGREAFLAEVKGVYESKLANLPGAAILWSDWEESVWHPGKSSPGKAAREGTGSWCFCDRCKTQFRQWAGLPPEADLTDDAIFQTYKAPWESFRADLDGKVAGVARQAARDLGKPYMLYSWSSHTKLWQALNGAIDLAFPGIPGNEAGSAAGQKHLDDTMAMFQSKVGLRRAQVMGQEFAMGHGYARVTNPRAFLNQPSDYEDPQLQKREILRIVAALGLGVDLCSSMDRVGGMLYWIGEATRILAAYEDLFHEGERDDSLAACDTLQYPDVLVLRHNKERLVLLFNEGDQPRAVAVRHRDVLPGQVATVFESDLKADAAAEMQLTIPAQDVAVIHVQ